MKKDRYFIGIDLGTSAIKLVLINQDLQLLTHKTLTYDVIEPQDGWREIDTDIWVERLTSGFNEIFETYPAVLVDTIAVTGQMHTLVLIDENGLPIRPALMWDDTRTADLIEPLRTKIRAMNQHEYIANTISTGSPAANLYWMKENEPSAYSKIRKFLIAPDYIVYRLTGTYGTDYCHASTSCLYDIPKRQWSDEMGKLLEIDEAVYPLVRGSGEIAGIILPEVAARFGLRADVKVLTGTGDNPAAILSTGCLEPEHPVISLGTSGVLVFSKTDFQEKSKGKIILFSLDGQQFVYLVQGAVQSNGKTYSWWFRNILGIQEHAEMENLLSNYNPLGNELLFFPHMSGEKTLYANPALRGAFFGLSTSSTKEDMAYAVIEGLCYGYRDLAEKMGLNLQTCKGIKIVGGGSRNSVWAQIMANVLNTPIEQMEGETGAGYGMALLAAHHSGAGHSLDHLSTSNAFVKQVFYPNPQIVPHCERKYENYLRIYPALRGIFETQE